MVVRNMSDQVYKNNRQRIMLSGFCLCQGLIQGKSEYFGAFCEFRSEHNLYLVVLALLAKKITMLTFFLQVL